MRKVKKILVIRFSAFGDLLNITPILRSLKKQLNGITLAVVTKSQNQALLKGNPYVDQFFYLESNWSQLLNQCKTYDADIIIDLHKNIRSYRLSMFLGVKTLRFKKERLKKILLTSWGIDKLDGRHTTDRYFEALASIGIVNDYNGLDFHNVIEYPDVLAEPYIAINLGGSKPTKRIDTKLIKDFITNSKDKICLLGGEDVSLIADELAAQFPTQISNYVGKTSFGESAYVILKSRYLITSDSVLMHLAAALKHPQIVVWGPTSRKLGLYPLYPKGQDLSKDLVNLDLSCHPCHHIGFDNCPKGHWNCMKLFSAKDLNSSINQLITRN